MPQLRGFSVGAKLDGLAKAKAALAAIPLATREFTAAAIADAAALTESEAKRRVRRRSGDLAGSVSTRTTPSGLTAKVGTWEYAPRGLWLEFGTKRMTAKPWLYPSFKRGGRLLRARLRGAEDEIGRVRFRSKRRKRQAPA